MLLRLGCLFVLVPLAELALLIQVGRWMGLVPTLALVAVTGLLGALLAQREGLRALGAVQEELRAGRVPGRPLMVAAAVLVGGAFLLTPGVLTDLAGLLLLLPPTRGAIYRWFRRRMERGIADGSIRVAWFGAGPMGSGTSGDWGRDAHGRDTSVLFEFDAKSDGDEDPRDDRPPRPGEIIQD